LRYYVAPAIALSLAVIRAMGADVESAVVWRRHPDLAFVCVDEGEVVTLSAAEPYCRQGTLEWLDDVNPLEVSAKLVRYSAEYDAVGLSIKARSSDAILEATVYAPGTATYLGLPPVDATIDVEHFGGAKVDTFYGLFKYNYEEYAEFVRALAKELKPIELEIGGRRAPLPLTYFAERIDASISVDDYRDLASTVPIYRHRLVESIVEDVAQRYRPKKPACVEVWNEVYEEVRSAFTWIGSLLLPRSPESYGEFVSRVVDLVVKPP